MKIEIFFSPIKIYGTPDFHSWSSWRIHWPQVWQKSHLIKLNDSEIKSRSISSKWNHMGTISLKVKHKSWVALLAFLGFYGAADLELWGMRKILVDSEITLGKFYAILPLLSWILAKKYVCCMSKIWFIIFPIQRWIYSSNYTWGSVLRQCFLIIW